MQRPSLAPTVLLSALRLSGKPPVSVTLENADDHAKIAGTGAKLS